MNATEQNAVRTFLASAADVVNTAVISAKSEDAEGYEGLLCALRAGAMLSLSATFSPTTHLAQLAIEVTEPNGEKHSLMHVELNRDALQ